MSVRRPTAFALEIVRDGGVETPVFQTSGLAARWQDTPDQCSVEGCGWEVDVQFNIARGLAVGRLSGHADGRRPRRQADPLPSSFHRQPEARKKAGPRAAGRRDRHLAVLQHMGRLERLSGHHRAGPRPICPAGLDAAAVVPRLRRAAARGAARAARNLGAAENRAALSAYGMGAGDRPFQEIHLVGLGELRQPFLPLGRARRLCGRPRQPARSAFYARNPRRLRLRRLRRPRRILDLGNARRGRRLCRRAAAMRRASPAISCGRRGWKTRGGGRSATNTAPAPKIRPTRAATSPAPPTPGKRPKSAGPAR